MIQNYPTKIDVLELRPQHGPQNRPYPCVILSQKKNFLSLMSCHLHLSPLRLLGQVLWLTVVAATTAEVAIEGLPKCAMVGLAVVGENHLDDP